MTEKGMHTMNEMNQLVFMHDHQAVTSSLQLAEVFEKSHKHVLEAADSLKGGVAENWADLFYEDVYTHPQNKQKYRIIYMNRDGFTLLAMGFTGKKALEFKLKYIAAFNRMEKVVKETLQLPSTPQEILALVLKNVDDSNKKVDELDKRLDNIEDNTPLSPSVYGYLSRRISQRVGEVARGFGHLSAKQRGQLFRDINQGIKQVSGVDTRSQLREKHYKVVVDFINDWEPSTATKTIVRQFVTGEE